MTGRPYPVADPSGYLSGTWRLTRRVRDEVPGVHGTFTGTAVFVPDGDTLAYTEDGVLELDGPHGRYRGPAHRALRYLPDGPGRLAVTFADGRPFHDLDLRTGHCRTHHPCGADAYTGEVTVRSADHWQQTWHVHGPAKSQHLASAYTRP